MKILHVTGDDYAAMHIEDEFGVEKAAKLAIDNGGKYTINTDEVYADLTIHEFKDVDKAFVDFVKYTLMDYDASKHENIFVIEEAE